MKVVNLMAVNVTKLCVWKQRVSKQLQERNLLQLVVLHKLAGCGRGPDECTQKLDSLYAAVRIKQLSKQVL